MPVKRWDSHAVQLLTCCTLMLVLGHPVAPASRGIVMPPAQTPNAPAPATTTPAPAPAPITPTTTAPALAPASVPVTPTAPAPDPAPDHQSPRHIWNVENILWAPDCKQLGMIGINGSFPGPTIYAYAGDRITVVVNNNKLHTEGVVIHWHGIKQIGTPWADGTASISQCHMNPRETFTYEFTADKPGTYFYHGHFGMQRAAGLYGLLIVHDRDDPFKKDPKYASDLNMLLSDWYHEAVYAQAAGLERKDKHFQWIGEPQTILINGRGQFRCSLGITRDHRACDRRKKDAFCQEGDKSERCELIRRSECGPFCEGSQCSPVVFAVEPGKRYRLRIASTTSLSALNVQVQGHKMTVVEADGNLVEPFDVESIDIYSGESYSVLLNTTAEKQGSSYWISDGVIGRTPKTPPALAALKYTGSKGELPVKAPPAAPAWNYVERSKKLARDLKARVGTDPPPEKVDRRIDMLNTQDLVDGQIKWAINHVSLSLPATPYLGAYKSGIQDQAFNTTAEAPSTFVSSYDIEKPPKDQKQEAKRNVTVSDRVYRLTHGHVIDVVLQNADMMRDDVSESHPWHLHRHDFWVLGYGDGRYDHEMATKNKELDVVNPPLRNTVVLFPHGWAAIRFVADNPGVWAFHCHIEPHLHMGMGVIFAEGMEAKKLHELDVPREAMMCGKTAVAASPPLLVPAMPPSP